MRFRNFKYIGAREIKNQGRKFSESKNLKQSFASNAIKSIPGDSK
jgi:hypothetical protein